MKWGHRFRMFHPDEAAGAPAPDDVVTQTFGPIENSPRPDLAEHEARHQEQLETQPPTPESTEEPAPAPEPVSEDAPQAETEAEPKAAPEAATAEAEGAGEEVSSNGETETPDELARLIAKYQGKPKESVLADLKELQGLQNRTAEERKAAQARFDKLAEVIDSHFDVSGDEYTLRSDVAAKALGQQRGQQRTGLPTIPTEKEVRATVEGQFLERLKESMTEDEAQDTLETLKPVIDSQVKSEVERHKTEAESERIATMAAIGQIADAHFTKNPGDKAFEKEISEVYSKVPPEFRHRALLEGWLPFAEVAEGARIRSNFKEALVEAFTLGQKHQSVEPTDGTPPSGGEGVPPRRSGRDKNPDQELKDAMMGSDVLTPIEDLFD